MNEFNRYIAVDWSGARGAVHPGIAVAACAAGAAAPELVCPGKNHWSRRAVADFLLDQAEKSAVRGERLLAGFDFTFAPPCLDRRGYLPGWAGSPPDVAGFWRLVEDLCRDDADFYGGAVAGHPALRAYFHQRGHKGSQYERRLRVTERACINQGRGRAESLFHLIGPSQVGLASFAGMRLLAHLKRENPAIAIWPFEPVAARGLTLVEIYCRLFLSHAGAARRKIRDWEALCRALTCFGSDPLPGAIRRMTATDHQTDALLSAAGLRHISGQAKYWTPQEASANALRYEGWTFGVC